jgi:acetyltransferase-like isoleucine patch superfamily enzyme
MSNFLTKVRSWCRQKARLRQDRREDKTFRRQARKNHVFLEKGVLLSNPRYLTLAPESRICSGTVLSCIDSYFENRYEQKINIGPGSRIGPSCEIVAASPVSIGANVFFGPSVYVTTVTHGLDPESPKPYALQPLQSKPITIGDGCWIGTKVIILPGVSLGEKCIIGAGAVVTKDIPSYSLAVGNPAKVIKKYSFESKTWERIN